MDLLRWFRRKPDPPYFDPFAKTPADLMGDRLLAEMHAKRTTEDLLAARDRAQRIADGARDPFEARAQHDLIAMLDGEISRRPHE